MPVYYEKSDSKHDIGRLSFADSNSTDQKKDDAIVAQVSVEEREKSPYPEGYAVCKPVGDPTIPAETLRAYIVGIFWVDRPSFIKQFSISAAEYILEFHGGPDRLNLPFWQTNILSQSTVSVF
ncbi:hypothetical protein V1504DRAFT_434955 [Lipomyces starkeyi]